MKMKIRSHVMLQMIIGYLSRIMLKSIDHMISVQHLVLQELRKLQYIIMKMDVLILQAKLLE